MKQVSLKTLLVLSLSLLFLLLGILIIITKLIIWDDAPIQLGFSSMLGLTFTFWALTSLLANWLVGIFLRPVEDLENQAKRALAGSRQPLKQLPGPRELFNIGNAFNHLNQSLERLLDEQANLIGKLQEDLYHDAQTGLHNRAYFISATEAALADMERPTGMLILRLNGLAEMNARQGRAAADWMIIAMAEKLANIAQSDSATAGRLDGGQFALLVESCDPDRLQRLAESLAKGAQQALQEAGAQEICTVHVGGAQATSDKRSALFSAADAALRDARLGASGSYRIATGTGPGEQDMRKALHDAIENNRFQVVWAPVMRCADQRIDHREAYARLPDTDGVMHAAGAFVHIAEAAGLIATVDEQIVTRTRMDLDQHQDSGAINLSAASLTHPGFANWLERVIEQPARILLEVSLPALLATPQALEAIHELGSKGFRIVLDRFVPDSTILPRLRELRPYAIKVEGVVCRQALDDVGSRAMLKSLCDHAHELGIQVGATGIEREDQRAAICELGFDMVQGQLYKAH